MLSNQQFESKWKEIKSGLRNLWGKLTDEELEEVKGNIYEVTGLVETKYHDSKEEIKKKLDSLMNSFDNDTDKSIVPDVDSYQRSPVNDRRPSYDYNTSIFSENFEKTPNMTFEKSELADEDDGVRDIEHETFAEKTFEKENEELHDPQTHSNYSQINPNREILGQPISPDKEKRDFDSDRNARH
jgi:uncharacterized protein YjbJ (UPF0337 family)